MNASAELMRPSSNQGGSAYAPEQFAGPIDLRLDGNEGPVPTEMLMRQLSATDPQTIRRYPSTARLEAQIAQRYGVAPDQVVVTAGADDALDRCCRLTLSPDAAILLTDPTFEMLPRYAQLAGADVRSIPWFSGKFPTRELIAAIDERVQTIAIVSPNNPTGNWATEDNLRAIVAAAPRALVVLDAVYGEFCEFDLTKCALEFPNVVVVRSFSKARGLAGLRVGYAIGHVSWIRLLRGAGGPFPTSGISLHLASEQLTMGDEHVDRFVQRVQLERDLMNNELLNLGAETIPSQANFVLARFENASWVRDGLASIGIGVRQWRDRPTLASWIRITCPGNEPDFDRLLRGLHCVVQPQAILFDMDGVLIDVSGSYRHAIIETAARFHVEVTAAQVAEAKRRGNANNDWDVAHQLIQSARVDVARDSVIATFNDLYNGTQDRAGLSERERPLVPVPLLERMAASRPLAIVTGRPRTEARRTLERFGMDRCFRTVVCMEDAPMKPNPAPVRLALAQLGVSSAWMLGDTIDDIRAARGAGIVSIGMIAPGDNAEATRSALLAAGAGRIIESVSELEAMLP